MFTGNDDDDDGGETRSERRSKLLREHIKGDVDKVWDITGGPNNMAHMSAGQFSLNRDPETTATWNRTAANVFSGFVGEMDSRLKRAGTGNKGAAGVYKSPKLGMTYDKALLPFKPSGLDKAQGQIHKQMKGVDQTPSGPSSSLANRPSGPYSINPGYASGGPSATEDDIWGDEAPQPVQQAKPGFRQSLSQGYQQGYAKGAARKAAKNQ